MKTIIAKRVLATVIALFSMNFIVGCAHLERGPEDKKPYYWYFHKPLPEASRKIDQARAAGKDQECPTEFNAAKDMVDQAYDLYIECHTQKAIDLAQEAIGKINALCPVKPKAEAPVVKPVEKVIAPAPAPAPAPKPVEPVVLAFEDIHFEFDKSTLSKEARELLKNNIRILEKNPKSKIRVIGFASAAGTVSYNQKLSERRANAVKAYLVNEGGMAADRFTTIGYGETKPIAHETTPKDINSKAAQANMVVRFEFIE